VKRIIFKLAFFLFLGAIASVAVAWGFAAFIDPIKFSSEPDDIRFRREGYYNWEFVETKAPGMTIFNSARGWSKELHPLVSHTAAPEELVPSWSDLGELSTEFKNAVACEPDSLVIERIRIHCFGWPFKCLWSFWEKLDTGDSSPVYDSGGYIFELEPWRYSVPRALPILPIWLGFVINTFIYSSMLWFIAVMPFTLRRTLRRKRGLCIKCGYDLRGTDHKACPECGNENISTI